MVNRLGSGIGIGIVAPSSKVPPVEFAMGVTQLKEEGFRVFVHPQCRKSHLFFSGKDGERAQALFDYAHDPRMQVLWCARGGSGAIRILPILEKLTAERGIPEKKLLVGYSDATALLEFVRVRWGWSTLHAPMPGIRAFCNLTDVERQSMLGWVRGQSTPMPWGKKRLRFVGAPLQQEIEGEVRGGNLTVWASLLGTSFSPRSPGAGDSILFFEDIGESLYRLDRVLMQLKLAGGLQGARAIVLGNFDLCQDVPPSVLGKKPRAQQRQRVLTSPQPKELMPLRPRLNADRVIPKLFAEMGEDFGIPVAYGLPVGHGPGHASLPLGRYRLAPNGSFELIHWDWIKSTISG